MINPGESPKTSIDSSDVELARRGLPGVPVQFILLLFVTYSTAVFRLDPLATSLFAAAIVLLNSVRTGLCLGQARFFSVRAPLWRFLFAGVLVASSFAWGLFSVRIFRLFDLVSLPSVFTLLTLCGIAAGSTTALAPRPRVARLFLLGLFLPPTAELLFVASEPSLALVTPFVTFFLFLWAQASLQAREFRAFHEALGHYRAIAENSGEGIAIHQGGQIVAANSAMAKIFSYAEAELLGLPIQVLCAPEEKAVMQARVDTGSAEIYPLQALRKDGSAFPVEVCGTLCEWRGKPARVVRIRDLTDQKNIEDLLKNAKEQAEVEVLRRTELLREQKAQMESILDNSPAVIVMKDLSGRYLLANRQFENLFGLTRESVWGKTDFELWEKPIAETLWANDRKVMETAQPLHAEELARQIDGLHTFMSVKFPVFDAAGKMKAVCMIATDVSDVKRISSEKADLEIREKSALEASRIKSEFLATMSHEIRTPINGVMGMTELLLDTSLSPEQKDFAETIRSSGQGLLAVINDILDFSKIEAGKLDFETVDFDLRQRIVEADRIFRFQAARKEIPLEFTFEGALPSTVRGDPGRFTQVLNNLVGNAIKFTDKGRVQVKVKAGEVSGGKFRLRIEVIDTGVGIPSEACDRLFRAFSQADASTTRRFGGSGLGLSIARGLIERMGGQIGMKSELGSGSTFWFELNMACGASGECALQKPAAPEKRKFSGARVLVAEDNLVNQKITLKILEKFGIEAVAVENGREALELLCREDFDLVLMDMQMPEMDGLAATRAVRKDPRVRNPGVPILALTANAIKGDAELCLASGMNDYLSKPISAKDLGAAIGKWLKPRRRVA